MKCEIKLWEFQRFDEGTVYLIWDKPKFIILADEISNSSIQELWLSRLPL
jgi:hypothetical protein